MDSARTSTARLKAMQPKQSGTSGLAAAKSNVVQQAKAGFSAEWTHLAHSYSLSSMPFCFACVAYGLGRHGLARCQVWQP